MGSLFGSVIGVALIMIKGREWGSKIPFGPYLALGSNRIEVEVATTMVNRLRVVQPDDFGNQDKQDYGLLGPAFLRPYVQMTVPLELE